MFVASAVDSILKQTFDDFELIIIDDASDDGTLTVLDKYVDTRIIRIDNPKQMGNYKCRNLGLAISRGKYICMMDGVDIAHPNGLQKQYGLMEQHPHILAAGSDIKLFSEKDNSGFKRLRNPDTIQFTLL